MAGGEQVLLMLNTLPGITDRPDAIIMPMIQGKIELDDVSFRYRYDLPEVLHNLSLSIQPGQTIALVGVPREQANPPSPN
jgi:ATP-binding cassette subfamily B protein